MDDWKYDALTELPMGSKGMDPSMQRWLMEDLDSEEEGGLADDCPICFCSPANLALRCQHAFCKECVARYVQVQVQEGVPLPKCPADRCTTLLTDVMVKDLLMQSEDHELLNFWMGFQDTGRPTTDMFPVRGLIPVAFRELQDHPLLGEALLAGPDVDYYYYNCFREADRGWGCAYRVLQSLVSHAESCGVKQPHRSYANRIPVYREEKEPPRECDGGWAARARNPQFVDDPPADPEDEGSNFYDNGMPSIVQLQRELADIGSLEIEAVGSKQWIEPEHAYDYITKRLRLRAQYKEYDLRGDPVQAAAALSAFVRDIWNHFDRFTAPIMIDDKTYTFCLVGVAALQAAGGGDMKLPRTAPENTAVLRFDPHMSSEGGLTRLMYGSDRLSIQAPAAGDQEEDPQAAKPVTPASSDPEDLLELGPGVKWWPVVSILLGKRWMVLFPRYGEDDNGFY